MIALAKLSNFVEIPISAAFVPAAVEVATTVPAVFVAVVKPAAKLPEYVPSAALAVLVDVAEAAVIPDVKLAKAAPTWVAVDAPVDVYVRPFTVADSPAASAVNAIDEDSSRVVVLPDVATGVVPTAWAVYVTSTVEADPVYAAVAAAMKVPV